MPFLQENLRNGYNRIRYDVWRLFEKLHLTSQLSAIYCIVSYGPKFELQTIKPNRYGQCTQGRCSTIPVSEATSQLENFHWKFSTENSDLNSSAGIGFIITHLARRLMLIFKNVRQIFVPKRKTSCTCLGAHNGLHCRLYNARPGATFRLFTMPISDVDR